MTTKTGKVCIRIKLPMKLKNISGIKTGHMMDLKSMYYAKVKKVAYSAPTEKFRNAMRGYAI